MKTLERNGIILPEIEYKAVLVRNPLKVKSSDWQETAHQWSVVINGQRFDYFTGSGHREFKPYGPYHPRSEYEHMKNKNLTELGFEKLMQSSKPTPPNLEDILYSLVIDSEACEMSFNDWADMFGYDSDSIKARKTYDACQENTDKLNKAKIYINDDIRKYYEDF